MGRVGLRRIGVPGRFFHGGHLTDLIDKQAFAAHRFKTDQIAQLGSFLLNQRLKIGLFYW